MNERRRARDAAGAAPAGWVLRLVGDGRLSAAAVGGSLVAVALIVHLAGGGAASVRATVDDVRAAVLACPATPAAGASTDRLTVSTALGEKADGAMRVDELPGEDKPTLRRTQPGVSRINLSGTDSPAAVVRATGGLAPGLAAERVVAVGEGPTRGLSSASCLPAGASAWFVGASTQTGRQSQLVLTNAAGTSASVDLTLWDEAGRLDVPNVSELVVAARSTRVVSLEGLADNRRRIAVGVVVDRGQVSAALHLAEIGGRGADWLDPLVRPAKKLVVPGIPAEAHDRKLFLLAPGDRDAIVKIRVLGTTTDFAPAGADVVELRAGQVQEVDLNAADPGQPLAVVLTSDVPVVGAVRTIAKIGGGKEQAWAGPAAALSGPTAVPDGRSGDGSRTRLLLAAPDEAAEVKILVYAGTGKPRTRTVTIEAGRLLVLDPGPKGVDRYSVVIEAVSGSVHAARVLRIDEAGITVTSLDTGRFTVESPAVVPDLTVTTVERD
ncbi:MAG: DUF5719 family protein [Sporichthyaceae bacterium]